MKIGCEPSYVDASPETQERVVGEAAPFIILPFSLLLGLPGGGGGVDLAPQLY
jgi:hypothetical protein